MRSKQGGKGEAARRRTRRRERRSLREWLALVEERFWALTIHQRFIGMVAAAFVVLVLCIAVLLPGLASRGQQAARATQTAEAEILVPVSGLVSTPTPEPTPTPPPPEMGCAYQVLYGDALGTVLPVLDQHLQYPALFLLRAVFARWGPRRVQKPIRMSTSSSRAGGWKSPGMDQALQKTTASGSESGIERLLMAQQIRRARRRHALRAVFVGVHLLTGRSPAASHASPM
jgi:hypothetical protein